MLRGERQRLCLRLDRELRRLSHHLDQQVKGALAEAGLTPSQAAFLGMLGEKGAMPVFRAARVLDVSCSAVSLLADRLHQAGLLQRVRSTGDRRVVWLQLTPEGHQLLDRVLNKRASILQELTSPLSQGDSEELLAVVSRLVAGLQEHEFPAAGR